LFVWLADGPCFGLISSALSARCSANSIVVPCFVVLVAALQQQPPHTRVQLARSISSVGVQPSEQTCVATARACWRARQTGS
jgi:hypothetical protein